MNEKPLRYRSTTVDRDRGSFRGNVQNFRRALDDDDQMFEELRVQGRIAVVIAVVGLLLLGASVGIGLRWLIVG